MPNPSRREIIHALTKHGLVTSVAGVVRDMGATVRQRTINDPREFGAFIDADTGEQLGEIQAGGPRHIEVGSLLRQMAPGHRYACVHAHPEDDGLSPDDVALVLKYRVVCVISAVGRHGHWHILSCDPGRPPPSPEQAAAAFNDTRRDVVDKYQQLVLAGQITRREARERAAYEIWDGVASALGLRYDRV